MKSLLSYFFKFKKDNRILPKEYPSDCLLKNLNQRSIIIITYNKKS